MFGTKRTSNPLAFALLAGALLLAAPPIWAKAYYPSAREMIQKAEFIAVVTIEEPIAQDMNGNTWTYGEVSSAQLKKSVKGKLPSAFKIHGKENFICAQCRFPKGESLVFLKKDHDLYAGQAWRISCLPVKDGKVEWFSNLNSITSDKQIDLDDCIKQIKAETKN